MAIDAYEAQEAAWKAGQIAALIAKHRLPLKSIADLACGTGSVLSALAKIDALKAATLTGYDAPANAATPSQADWPASMRLVERNPLKDPDGQRFDALLVIDYFEHVRDYLGLLTDCRPLASYKIFHVPLEISAASVLRDACVRNRYSLGHIHYFTAESALACLKDSGHEVIDYTYTDSAGCYLKLNPSLKKSIANAPRRWLAKLNVSLAAKIFGGYSLLVLTK